MDGPRGRARRVPPPGAGTADRRRRRPAAQPRALGDQQAARALHLVHARASTAARTCASRSTPPSRSTSVRDIVGRFFAAPADGHAARPVAGGRRLASRRRAADGGGRPARRHRSRRHRRRPVGGDARRGGPASCRGVARPARRRRRRPIPTSRERPTLQRAGAAPRASSTRCGAAVLKIRNFWTTLEEMEPGAVACLAALAAERRWDVLFVTTRPTAAGDDDPGAEPAVARGARLPAAQRLRGQGLARQDRRGAAARRRGRRPPRELPRRRGGVDGARRSWCGRRVRDDLPPGAVRHGVTVVPTITAALDTLLQFDRARSGGVGRSIRRLFGR